MKRFELTVFPPMKILLTLEDYLGTNIEFVAAAGRFFSIFKESNFDDYHKSVSKSYFFEYNF